MTNRNQVPLLSVVIPTRNRAIYAKSAITSILKIESDLFELIVQDNSDNDELDAFIKSTIHDNRLVYNHIYERLDVIENFSRGTDLSNGEYITYLGDDDGLNPEIIDALLWAKGKEIDALLSSRPAQYRWPDHKFKFYGDKFSGCLELSAFSGEISFPDIENELLKCVKSGGGKFFSLPRVYYGIVKRECLDKLHKKTGTYFPGPSPDLAGAVGVAGFVKNLCRIDYPLFVPGSSGSSTAGLGAMKKHIGKLEDWPHLPKHYVQSWSTYVPRFFSGPTIWGEDVVQALIATDRRDLLDKFNIYVLHAKCIIQHPEYYKIIKNNFYASLLIKEKSKILGSIKLLYYGTMFYFERLKALRNRIDTLLGRNNKTKIQNLTNIDEAVVALGHFTCKFDKPWLNNGNNL